MIAEQKFRLSRRKQPVETVRQVIDNNAERRIFGREDVVVFKLKDYFSRQLNRVVVAVFCARYRNSIVFNEVIDW